MKNLRFLIFSCIVCQATAFAQAYQEFPEVDGYWKVQYSDVWCLDIHYTNPICSEYQYILTGDTTINEGVYHKLSYSGRDRNPDDETWTYWDKGYYGSYRNDAPNKKVYFIPKDSASEQLLYDFNLDLNDTLPDSYVYNRSEDNIITVDGIDSILVTDTYLKRYHLDNADYGNAYLIEGIGSTLGLFSEIVPFFEQDYTLLCFKNETDDLYYPFENANECDLITGVDNNAFAENEFSISPNPASEYIFIRTPGQTPEFQISIFNCQGRLILQSKITGTQTTVNVSGLSDGIYLVKLISDKIVDVFKLIKKQ